MRSYNTRHSVAEILSLSNELNKIFNGRDHVRRIDQQQATINHSLSQRHTCGLPGEDNIGKSTDGDIRAELSSNAG